MDLTEFPERRITAVLRYHLTDGTTLEEHMGMVWGEPTEDGLEMAKAWASDSAVAELAYRPHPDSDADLTHTDPKGDICHVWTPDKRLFVFDRAKIVYIECDVIVSDLEEGDIDHILHNREVDELQKIGKKVLKEET